MPDETEEKFRKLVRARYGDVRGALSIAIKEAIEKWMREDVQR